MFMGVKYGYVHFQIAFEIQFNKQFFSNLRFQLQLLFKPSYIELNDANYSAH